MSPHLCPDQQGVTRPRLPHLSFWRMQDPTTTHAGLPTLRQFCQYLANPAGIWHADGPHCWVGASAEGMPKPLAGVPWGAGVPGKAAGGCFQDPNINGCQTQERDASQILRQGIGTEDGF